MREYDTVQMLFQKAKAKDREAFERLMEPYQPRLASLVSKQMGPLLKGKMAEGDVVQEVMMKAYQCLDQFQWQDEEAFFHWLSGIARNLILHLSRQYRRKQEISLHGDVTAKDISPIKKLRRNDRFDRLQEAMKGLNPDHREVIVLSRIEGLSVQEIAGRMDRSPQAIYQLLWRAMQKLRVLFGETESLSLPHQTMRDGEQDGEGKGSH